MAPRRKTTKKTVNKHVNNDSKKENTYLHYLNDYQVRVRRRDIIRNSRSLAEYELEQKIKVEFKMKEGSSKLLAVAQHCNQSLEAAKALLVSSEKMSAYTAELQHRKQEPHSRSIFNGPTHGRVSLSDIRIPLMWRDSDHFRNRGDHRRFAVFCLARLGTEIHDTSLLCPIDRIHTDISFSDSLLFNNVPTDFELVLEIYSHVVQEDLSIASTPRKIKKTIHSSISKTVGKKFVASFRDEFAIDKIEPHFNLVATATLKLDDTGDAVRTHDLVINKIENKYYVLPMFDHFCCRLATQPECIVNEVCVGNLSVNDQSYWARLKGFHLELWKSRKIIEENQAPSYTIPINKETSVELLKHSAQELKIINRVDSVENVLVIKLNSHEETQRWLKTLIGHIQDHLKWKRAAECIQKVSCVESTRNSFITVREKHGSLYDETPLTDSPSSIADRSLTKLAAQKTSSCHSNTGSSGDFGDNSIDDFNIISSSSNLHSKHISGSNSQRVNIITISKHYWPFSNKSYH